VLSCVQTFWTIIYFMTSFWELNMIISYFSIQPYNVQTLSSSPSYDLPVPDQNVQMKKATVVCHNCGEVGHKSISCPKSQKTPDLVNAYYVLSQLLKYYYLIIIVILWFKNLISHIASTDILVNIFRMSL